MISLLMDHAVAEGLRPDNPATGVKRLRYKAGGFVTWTEADIAAFRAFWPLGSRERLAFELALNTGHVVAIFAEWGGAISRPALSW
jgi:hypothetical protein